MTAVIKSRLTELELDEISLVDVGDNPGSHVTFFKRKGGLMGLFSPRREVRKADPMPMPEGEAAPEAPALTLDAVLAKVAAMGLGEDELALLQEALGVKAEEVAAEADDLAAAAEMVAKRADVPDVVRVAISKLRAEHDALQAEVSKRIDAEALAVRVSKQRQHGALLPETAEERGSLIHEVAKLAPNLADRVEAMLDKVAAETAVGGAFAEFGKRTRRPANPLDARAQALKAADARLTDAQALTMALRENPGAYYDSIEGGA